MPPSQAPLDSLLIWIQWSKWLPVVDKLIIVRKKILPGLTTLEANDNFPINDNNSRFLHDFLESQVLIKSFISDNFSTGNLQIIKLESSSIPR